MLQLKKKAFMFLAATTICISLLFTSTALAVNENEPVKSTIADRLVIELGPEWAGAEFELVTDMGKYPGTIKANDAGVLTTELGDSNIYTLTRLTTAAAPLPATEVESPEAEQPELSTPAETEAVERSTSDSASDGESTPPDAESPDADAPAQIIPTKHLVLFLGGAGLGIAGLIIMYILKRRNAYYEEDDDE